MTTVISPFIQRSPGLGLFCVFLWAVASCGGPRSHTDAPTPAEVSTSTRPEAPEESAAPREPSPPPESAACRSSRVAFLEDAEVSRQRPCAADDDCAVISSSESRDPARAVVVHAADAIRLDVEVQDHLSRCDAQAGDDQAEGAAVIEAVCAGGVCASRSTGALVAEPSESPR